MRQLRDSFNKNSEIPLIRALKPRGSTNVVSAVGVVMRLPCASLVLFYFVRSVLVPGIGGPNAFSGPHERIIGSK
jgi:hypothetical protein